MNINFRLVCLHTVIDLPSHILQDTLYARFAVRMLKKAITHVLKKSGNIFINWIWVIAQFHLWITLICLCIAVYFWTLASLKTEPDTWYQSTVTNLRQQSSRISSTCISVTSVSQKHIGSTLGGSLSDLAETGCYLTCGSFWTAPHRGHPCSPLLPKLWHVSPILLGYWHIISCPD